jgi:HAD superfamily hydrolase (TIGR01509 family)
VDGLLIFDCDGVLVDSEILEHTVDAEILAAHGYETTVNELIGRFVGIARTDMYATIFGELDRPLPDGLLDRRERMVWSRCERDLRTVPGVIPALEAMPDVTRCVASSSTPDKLRMKLDATGLTAWFTPHIFSTALVPRGKPAPDIYLHAARVAGVPAESCIVVEDSPHGIAGAKAAGMKAVGFAGGAHFTASLRAELEAAGARAIVDSMDRLPPLLRAQLG